MNHVQIINVGKSRYKIYTNIGLPNGSVYSVFKLDEINNNGLYNLIPTILINRVTTLNNIDAIAEFVAMQLENDCFLTTTYFKAHSQYNY